MKVDKYNSWKAKLGLAFGDITKVHLDYIKITHACSANKRKRYLLLYVESLISIKRKD
jgi:hypothetical protein